MALKPIVMTPAYRYGAATPWGGSALKTVYGQDIPDERTGEALAFSALPGLNSRDASGRTLTELIAEYGAVYAPPMTGDYDPTDNNPNNPTYDPTYTSLIGG